MHVLDRVVSRVGITPLGRTGLGLAGVVSGGEYQTIVADGPGDLLLFLPGNRMGPQVLDPDAFLRGLGYLYAKFLSVGADHILDVGPDQVRKDGMSKVDVILTDEEQVELSVQAFLAVVVIDGSVQAVGFVPCYGFVDVFLHGIRYVFHQDRMAGREQQAVVEDDQHSSRLFLLGDWVNSPSHEPLTFNGGGFQQLGEARIWRTRTDILAFQGGNVAIYQQLAFALSMRISVRPSRAPASAL